MNNEQITETNVVEMWASQYPEVIQWLSHLQKKDKNAINLYHFCQWAHKTPTELLKLKTDPASKAAEKLLNTFSSATLDMTNSVQYQTITSVRSFYKWNMCDLSKIAGQMEYEKVKAYNKLTREGLRKLWNSAYNPRDRALITITFSTAMAKETLSNLQWKHLEDGWENVELPCVNLPATLIKGHGRGKYRNVRQITFLTPEAKRDLLTYREWIEKAMGRKMTPDDNVFRETYAPYKPETYASIGYLGWALSQRAGVPFSWHDGRRWVNTALEQIGISQNWARKIRGRMCRGEEAPYSQPAIDQLREKFRQAVDLLQFTSEQSTVSKETLRAEMLKFIEEKEEQEIADKFHVSVERVRDAKRTHKDSWMLALQKDKEKCEDGKHCQRIVSESELPALLAEGGHVAAVLPSGKVVVET